MYPTLSTEESEAWLPDSYSHFLGSPVVDKHLNEMTNRIKRVRILCFGEFGIGKSSFLSSYSGSTDQHEHRDTLEQVCEVYVKLLNREGLFWKKRTAAVGAQLYCIPNTYNKCYIEEQEAESVSEQLKCSQNQAQQSTSEDQTPKLSQKENNNANYNTPRANRRYREAVAEDPQIQSSPKQPSSASKCIPSAKFDSTEHSSTFPFDGLVFFFEVGSTKFKQSVFAHIRSIFPNKSQLDKHIWQIPILLVGLKKDKLSHSQLTSTKRKVARDFSKIFDPENIVYYGRDSSFSSEQSSKCQFNQFVVSVCEKKLGGGKSYQKYLMMQTYQSMYQLYYLQEIMQALWTKGISKLPIYREKRQNTPDRRQQTK